MAASLQWGWEFGMDPLMAHGSFIPLAMVGDWHYWHPTFNFPLFSGGKLMSEPKSPQSLHCAVTVLCTPLSSLLDPNCRWRSNPLPSGRQWNPDLGSIRIETSLEMWWRWKCWCESLWLVPLTVGGDFCGWFLGGVFKIRVRDHSENVSLSKSDL